MKIYVVLDNIYIGVISEEQSPTSFEFSYEDNIHHKNYLLGLNDKHNKSSHLFHIFEDLIPENEDKINTLKAKHDINSTIEVLLYLGNVHGSFEFYKTMEEARQACINNKTIFKYNSIKSSILGEYKFPNILDYKLIDFPDGTYNSSDVNALGLSGYQDKFAVIKDDESKNIRYVDNVETEYFVKPLNLNFTAYNRGSQKFKEYKKKYHPFLLINEHIFMSLAKKFGFDVPYNALIKDHKYNEYHLLIKRFDRYNIIHKFNHHTVNSFMGKLASDKYNVTVSDIVSVIKDDIDYDNKLILFRFIVFSILISHGDLHAKNLSLIYCSNSFEDKTKMLSPVYDILTTNIYSSSQRDQDIAMKLNNKKSNIRVSDLLVISRLLEIPDDYAKEMIQELCHKFLDLFIHHINELPPEILGLMIKVNDYSNKDITLSKQYHLYFTRRKDYIEKYLLSEFRSTNIFNSLFSQES